MNLYFPGYVDGLTSLYQFMDQLCFHNSLLIFFIELYIVFLGILYIYRSILYVDIYDHIFWIIYILLIVYFVNFLLVYGIFGRVREKRRREKFLVSLFL